MYFMRLVDVWWVGLGSRYLSVHVLLPTCSNSNGCRRSFSQLKLHLPAKCPTATGNPCLGTVNWGVRAVSDLACLGSFFWQFILREDGFG